jgi:hypothetical protein
MIVLSEDSPARPRTRSARENHVATEAARTLGLRVYYMPEDFSQCGDAEGALAYVPVQDIEVPGTWIGFIPDPQRYSDIYDAALRRRIRLLNDPEQHLTAQEFDRTYPRLAELTPRSVVITDPDQCDQAVVELGLPVFVKGAVQSRKARGWKACVAETPDELTRLTTAYLSLPGRTRGRVIVRELVKLRHVQSSPEGFPFGREYRVFLYKQDVLGYGYYWEGDDPLEELSPTEEATVLRLAQGAAARIGTPFVAIDIGQLDDDGWIVIESGDAQFAGYSKIPVLSLWSAISRIKV